MEEAVADPYFLERSASAGYRQTRVSNNYHSFKIKPIENLAYGNSLGGLLGTPPRLLSAPSFHSQQYYPFIQLQQPPLLPSPSPIQRAHRSLPSQGRSQSLNPKKSKSTKREQESKQYSTPAVDRRASSGYLIKTWKNGMSNHKSHLAGDAFRISSATPPSPPVNKVVTVEELDKLSGCLFTLSPPPSSLPLPKFSLKPAKLNCNVEAAGADDGATDDLRRLLRLH